MEKLRILLKNGEAKTFPWKEIGFKYTYDNALLKVWKFTSEPDNFLFGAPLANVEYIERINDESE